MKINLAPLCGIFKRHSPSRHTVWTLFCLEGFKPRPRFLCRHCSKNCAPETIKALRPKRRPPRAMPNIDEWSSVPLMGDMCDHEARVAAATWLSNIKSMEAETQ